MTKYQLCRNIGLHMGALETLIGRKFDFSKRNICQLYSTYIPKSSHFKHISMLKTILKVIQYSIRYSNFSFQSCHSLTFLFGIYLLLFLILYKHAYRANSLGSSVPQGNFDMDSVDINDAVDDTSTATSESCLQIQRLT